MAVGPDLALGQMPVRLAPRRPRIRMPGSNHSSMCRRAHAVSNRSSCLLPGYLGRPQCSVVPWTVVLVDGQTRRRLFLRAVRRPPVREGSEAVAVGGMRNTASNEFGLFCFTRLWGDMR